VYSEGVLEEATYLLVEWLATPVVQGSIAFPEIIVPIVVLLRKCLKATNTASGTSSGKDVAFLKVVLERIEESVRWVEQKRKGVSFVPGKLGEVERWEKDLRAKIEESPLGKYLKVQRKIREKRRKLMEKVCAFFREELVFLDYVRLIAGFQAREGEDEILEEE